MDRDPLVVLVSDIAIEAARLVAILGVCAVWIAFVALVIGGGA